VPDADALGVPPGDELADRFGVGEPWGATGALVPGAAEERGPAASEE
jgi:hypothetical protein